MQSHALEAGHGWQWIVEGFRLFRKNPLIWIVLTTILFFIALALGVIPFIGAALFSLLSPIFTAGLMAGCRALEKDEEIEIAHLFGGFRLNTGDLITIGGVYLIGQILIYGVLVLVGGDALSAIVSGAASDDRAATPVAIDQLLPAAVAGLALSLPLWMAVWFAPLLVMFDKLTAVAALKQSFAACLKNVAPFLVYAIVFMILGVIAAIPFGLGFLILAPMLFGSVYASYKDVFKTGLPGGRLRIGDSEMP